MREPEVASPAELSSSQYLCDLSRLSAADSKPHADSEWSGLSNNCILYSDEQYPCTLEPQTLKISGIIYSSDETTVYAAHCRDHDGTDLEVVLKFTDERERIIRECEAYRGKLSSLQDIVVPKFYGMLSMQETTLNEYRSCLVIERFGTRMQRGTLRYHPVGEKYVPRLTYYFLSS